MRTALLAGGVAVALWCASPGSAQEKPQAEKPPAKASTAELIKVLQGDDGAAKQNAIKGLARLVV
jgi:hypothetical protein